MDEKYTLFAECMLNEGREPQVEDSDDLEYLNRLADIFRDKYYFVSIWDNETGEKVL